MTPTLRRIVRGTVVIGAGGVVVLAVLYAFVGLRIEYRGGGTPYLTFSDDLETRAAAIAQHREQQRTAAPEAAATAPVAATAGAPAAGTAAEPAPVVDESAAAPYWTDFRGPVRDGHYRERPINTKWPAAGLEPIWKQPVGGGYASFVVARGRAFTIEQRGPQEVAAAYDVMTGRELWTNGWPALFREPLGGDGPRATPTWADGVVYALGATGELRALDETNGRALWRTNILADSGAANLDWGMASSPLVVGNTVVVLPGGSGGRSVMAYDRRTGSRAWSALDDKQAYSSPMIATVAGVRQLVMLTASRLIGVTPDRGEVLWEYPWRTDFDINASQPVIIGDNRVFVSTGYGTGAAVVEITADNGRFAVREVWRNNRMKNQFTSSVLHDGFIYGLDESILACLDAATGELKWKGGRYGYGQVMLAGGHLIVLTENGELALVRARPDRHEELVRFPALEGKTWNHPALADGILLVRNDTEMAAFDLR